MPQSFEASPQAVTYSAVELLRDGQRLEIRALRPADRADFVAAVGLTSAQSLYRRFFSPKRRFTEAEVAFYLDVDFVDHVALIAVMEEDGRPAVVGGGRYFVGDAGQAELALVVVDRYQGRGIGSALVRHLAIIARAAGLSELVAQVLSDNFAMLHVFKKAGFRITRREAGIVHLGLRLG